MLITGLHLVPVCFLDFRNIRVREGNKSWTLSCYPRQWFRRFLALVSIVVDKLNQSHRMHCSYIKTILSCWFLHLSASCRRFFHKVQRLVEEDKLVFFNVSSQRKPTSFGWAATYKTDGFLIAASCLRMCWRLSGSVNTHTDSMVCVKTRFQNEYVWQQTAALAVNGRWHPWGLRWGGCIV